MPSLKALAPLALASMAAFLPSTAFAEGRSFHVCATNKAWVVWNYSVTASFNTLLGYENNHARTPRYSARKTQGVGGRQLLLGESFCHPVPDDWHNITLVVRSNYGGELNVGPRSSDITIRLDGTAFDARMSTLDGIILY